MGKFRKLSGKEICSILSKHNFEEVRKRGSHIVMQRKLTGSTITVPVPNHKEVRIGTLLSIIRQSRINRNEFEL